MDNKANGPFMLVTDWKTFQNSWDSFCLVGLSLWFLGVLSTRSELSRKSTTGTWISELLRNMLVTEGRLSEKKRRIRQNINKAMSNISLGLVEVAQVCDLQEVPWGLACAPDWPVWDAWWGTLDSWRVETGGRNVLNSHLSNTSAMEEWETIRFCSCQ